MFKLSKLLTFTALTNTLILVEIKSEVWFLRTKFFEVHEIMSFGSIVFRPKDGNRLILGIDDIFQCFTSAMHSKEDSVIVENQMSSQTNILMPMSYFVNMSLLTQH